MNKKAVSRIGKSMALLLLLSSSLPFSLAYAETVEEVPTSETTISTMADDPLKDKTESTTDHVPTIEESDKEATQTTTSETASTEETKTTDSSTEDATKKKPKPKPFGGGVGPQTVNLIEGVDIDADFAQLLRTGVAAIAVIGGGPWSGLGKGQDQLTDDDMAALSRIIVSNRNLASLKGIEYAVNLEELDCWGNAITTLDLRSNTALKKLECKLNQLSNLDITGCTELENINCSFNKLTTLDLTSKPSLKKVDCNSNQITALDATASTALTYLDCHYNLQMNSLNLPPSTELTYLNCSINQITTLDISANIALTELDCSDNQITALDVGTNTALTKLSCNINQLTTLDIAANLELNYLDCAVNQLTRLDASNNTKLEELVIAVNKISSLNDLSILNSLENLHLDYNMISDITPLQGFSNLTKFYARFQEIKIPVPKVNSGQAKVEVLKTTAHTGLTATNGDVTPVPTFTYNGDDIVMSNVSRPSLSDKFINFSYDGTQLTEGASSGMKEFGGTITFFTASDLENELSANKKKVNSGDEVEWTWKITSLSVKKAEDVHATLNVPAGWVVDPSSVTKNGSPATIGDIDGTNSHGDMNTGEVITFTFKTTASGNAGEWLDVKGRLDWKDDTITSPYDNESKVSIQILDDEQTYTPKDSNDIALQSVPISFDYGSHHNVSASAQTHHLGAANYQSNTNVVTDGFYTRVKDDRTISTGWKLTAKLSEFRDSGNQVMPNGAGTSLKLENMTIERVTDRDTPQEVIDPTPSGADVPSSVTATETLVAGQATAKTLVHAQVNEGRETWQLRMPFDKVSLNVPANAGKKATRYRARLTWSLDDTL
ncbi:hypothetical protein IGI66_003596 [Enterococcus sp. AZ048]|uniref:WxL domain-containing protein n=1 Tax=Enterococcus sp. AZ048 TaxID=2774658 RepID=UPI003F22F5C8